VTELEIVSLGFVPRAGVHDVEDEFRKKALTRKKLFRAKRGAACSAAGYLSLYRKKNSFG
jgi:hypothetical protein